jgi:O-acetylserine/cysteine efflux transporter
MSLLDLFLTVILLLIWGINFAISKAGLELLPPLLFVTLRFLIAAVLLVPFARVPRGQIGMILVLATIFAAHFALMYIAMQSVDAGIAAITSQAQVPFSSIMSAIVFKDHIGWRRALGLAIAFVGIFVLFGEPRLSAEPLPVFLILVAACLWASANILIKRMSNFDGYALNAYVALFIAPELLIASLVMEQGQVAAMQNAGWVGWGAVAFVAILVAVVSYIIWYRLLRRYPVNYIMPITLLVPVLGVLFGVLLRGEPLTWPIISGGVITLAGVGIIVLRRPQTAAPEAATKSL